MNEDKRNTGHGHVNPRPDGVKARCGGPGFCKVCSAEKSRAIVPPVAAGSVDTAPFDLRKHKVGGGEGVDTLNLYINAWGAQQREAGKQEALDLTVSIGQLRQRAEKAEAELAAYVAQSETDFARMEGVAEQWKTVAAAAEARVKELERESAHKQAIIDRLMLEYCPDEMTAEQVEEWGKHQVRATVGIVGSGPDAKEGDRPCWTPDCGTF